MVVLYWERLFRKRKSWVSSERSVKVLVGVVVSVVLWGVWEEDLASSSSSSGGSVMMEGIGGG